MTANFETWCRVLPGRRKMIATVLATVALSCVGPVANAQDANAILKAMSAYVAGQ